MLAVVQICYQTANIKIHAANIYPSFLPQLKETITATKARGR